MSINRMILGGLVILMIMFMLMREGYIVFDRSVFSFQVDPVLEQGEIKNLREYKIIHNYIEMTFDRSPDDFDKSEKIKIANELMVMFHAKNS